MKPTWMITRQRYYYSQSADRERDVLTVEISKGREGWTADALCKQYPGEFEAVHDPREAVETAWKIRGLWLQDYLKAFFKNTFMVQFYPGDKSHRVLEVSAFGCATISIPFYKARPWHYVESLLNLFVTVNSGGIHGYEGEPMTRQEMDTWALNEWGKIENCCYCGAILDIKDYVYDELDEDSKFCDGNCYENWRSDQPVMCEQCGEMVEPNKVIWDNENPFCSQKCLDEKTKEDNEDEDI